MHGVKETRDFSLNSCVDFSFRVKNTPQRIAPRTEETRGKEYVGSHRYIFFLFTLLLYPVRNVNEHYARRVTPTIPERRVLHSFAKKMFPGREYVLGIHKGGLLITPDVLK